MNIRGKSPTLLCAGAQLHPDTVALALALALPVVLAVAMAVALALALALHHAVFDGWRWRRRWVCRCRALRWLVVDCRVSHRARHGVLCGLAVCRHAFDLAFLFGLGIVRHCRRRIGHLGRIELALPVYLPALFPTLVQLMRGKCLHCHAFRVPRDSLRPLVDALALMDAGLLIDGARAARTAA